MLVHDTVHAIIFCRRCYFFCSEIMIFEVNVCWLSTTRWSSCWGCMGQHQALTRRSLSRRCHIPRRSFHRRNRSSFRLFLHLRSPRRCNNKILGQVWNNGKHGIIASKRCDHVSIQNNEVW
ncbi:unnamed protein product, partial [Ectocarpus sp. 12 AP-2014]